MGSKGWLDPALVLFQPCDLATLRDALCQLPQLLVFLTGLLGGFKVGKGTTQMEPGSLKHREVTALAEGHTASLKAGQAWAAVPIVSYNEGCPVQREAWRAELPSPLVSLLISHPCFWLP